jgi:hypothetical protein
MASVPPSWNARFTFGTAYQRQDFDTGSIARNANANVGIAVQHQQWGMFSAAMGRGHTAQLAGAYADSQTYQSEFSKPLSKKHSVKFYISADPHRQLQRHERERNPRPERRAAVRPPAITGVGVIPAWEGVASGRPFPFVQPWNRLKLRFCGSRPCAESASAAHP